MNTKENITLESEESTVLHCCGQCKIGIYIHTRSNIEWEDDCGCHIGKEESVTP